MDRKPFTIFAGMSMLLFLFAGCATKEAQVTTTSMEAFPATAQPQTTEAVIAPSLPATNVKPTTTARMAVSTTAVPPTAPQKQPEEYRPEINPNDYVPGVDNPYFVLRPGTTYVYEGMLDGEAKHIEAYVANEVKKILGVAVMQVRERVYVKGKLEEETLRYYAQDRDGNVWCFGRDRSEYQYGRVTGRKGSWEAGVNGAEPGIIMLGDASQREPYRQSYLEGETEDMAQIIKTGEAASTQSGTYKDVIIIKEWTQLKPGAVTWKYYARDVGMIIEVRKQGGSGEIDLAEIKKG